MKLYRVSWVIDPSAGQIAISGLWEVEALDFAFAAAKVKVMVGEEYSTDIDKVRIIGLSREKEKSAWQ